VAKARLAIEANPLDSSSERNACLLAGSAIGCKGRTQGRMDFFNGLIADSLLPGKRKACTRT
jgi:hypothetical protein